MSEEAKIEVVQAELVPPPLDRQVASFLGPPMEEEDLGALPTPMTFGLTLDMFHGTNIGLFLLRFMDDDSEATVSESNSDETVETMTDDEEN